MFSFSMGITRVVHCKEVESTLRGCALVRDLVCYSTVFSSCYSGSAHACKVMFLATFSASFIESLTILLPGLLTSITMTLKATVMAGFDLLALLVETLPDRSQLTWSSTQPA